MFFDRKTQHYPINSTILVLSFLFQKWIFRTHGSCTANPLWSFLLLLCEEWLLRMTVNKIASLILVKAGNTKLLVSILVLFYGKQGILLSTFLCKSQLNGHRYRNTNISWGCSAPNVLFVLPFRSRTCKVIVTVFWKFQIFNNSCLHGVIKVLWRKIISYEDDRRVGHPMTTRCKIIPPGGLTCYP